MIATTLEQSRKLVELGIDTSTADMHYAFSMIGGDAFQEMIDNSATLLPGKKNTKYPYEPAWSLSALLDILPNNEHISTTISRGSWKIDTVEYVPNTWWCEYEDTENQTEFNIPADNPVDACVKMIIKLKEKNLL